MIHEGLLHWMQLFAVGEALDSPNLFAVRLRGKHQAGAHRLAVDDDGTGAADTMLAADMGSGLSAILADRVCQGAPWFDGYGMIAAVDRERDIRPGAHATFSAVRRAARMRCGVAGISSISTPNG